MKKRIVMFVAALAVVGGVVAAIPSAQAESKFVSSDKDVTLAKSEVHNGSYFATGQDIVINGTITGDLYCAGQTVEINGTVNGDVLCAAQTIKINGIVKQDVRSAAQFVNISGSVEGTVTSFGQDVEVSRNAVIGGDFNGAAQNISVDGTVKRDLAVAADRVSISGVVEGSARLEVGTLSLTSEPAIKGNLEYTASGEQDVAKSAVSGIVTVNKDGSLSNDDQAISTAINIFLFIAGAMMVTAIVIALVAPRTLERSYTLVQQKVVLTILVGVAVNFGLPIFALALAATGVGVPLALMLFSVLVIVYIAAFPFAAYYLSRALFGQVIHNVVLLIIAGMAMLLIGMVIPILNILVYFAVLVVGAGGVVVTLTNGYRKPQYSITPNDIGSSKK